MLSAVSGKRTASNSGIVVRTGAGADEQGKNSQLRRSRCRDSGIAGRRQVAAPPASAKAATPERRQRACTRGGSAFDSHNRVRHHQAPSRSKRAAAHAGHQSRTRLPTTRLSDQPQVDHSQLPSFWARFRVRDRRIVVGVSRPTSTEDVEALCRFSPSLLSRAARSIRAGMASSSPTGSPCHHSWCAR